MKAYFRDGDRGYEMHRGLFRTTTAFTWPFKSNCLGLPIRLGKRITHARKLREPCSSDLPIFLYGNSCFFAIGQQKALSDGSAWLLSDFMAFYHLFQGLIPNQTWLHSLELESLVKPAGFTSTEAKLLVTSML